MSNEQAAPETNGDWETEPRWGALSALLSPVNLTGHTDRLGAAGKRIATVDEDRGCAMESDSLRCLGRVDALVLARHLAAWHSVKDPGQPLVGQLPMGTPVEILERDFHKNMISCFPDMSPGVLAPPDRVAAARFFRVLGDPTRLHILELLDEGELAVGELVAAVGQPQPRVSTHLACLRHCGFVRAERRGKEIVYSLALRGLDRIAQEADSALEPVAERLATCTRIGPDWM